MRGLREASRQRVAMLRRTAAGLGIAALLAVSSGQPFHPGAAFAAGDGFAVAASRSGAQADSLPHGGAHLPGLCSICRAIGQARVGVRSPAIAAAGCVDAVGLPAPHEPFAAAQRAPGLAHCGPRAPPGALPALHA